VGRFDGFLVKVGLELGSLLGYCEGLAETGIEVGFIVSAAISVKQICHPPRVML